MAGIDGNDCSFITTGNRTAGRQQDNRQAIGQQAGNRTAERQRTADRQQDSRHVTGQQAGNRTAYR